MTTEEWMSAAERLPLKPIKEQVDYHTMALLAAQTLPNQSIGELLGNAEKIEKWLMAPEIGRIEMSRKLMDALNGWGTEQKSPEINPEASDGVSDD